MQDSGNNKWNGYLVGSNGICIFDGKVERREFGSTLCVGIAIDESGLLAYSVNVVETAYPLEEKSLVYG